MVRNNNMGSKTMFPVLLLLVLCAGFSEAQTDLQAILRRAASDFASSVGTSITAGALGSGVCFSRDDDSKGNKDTCSNQPSSFTFISYGQTSLSNNVNTSPPQIGTTTNSSAVCNVPSDGQPQTCGTSNGYSKSTQWSIANTESFTATIAITVGASFGEPPLQGKFDVTNSFSFQTSTTATQSSTETSQTGATTSFMVQPGHCAELVLSSTPTTYKGTVQYIVPVEGAISVWFADKKGIPDGDGQHYNWNIPVETLIPFAVKGGYAGGLSVSSSGNVVYTGTIAITTVSLVSEGTQAACPTSKSASGRKLLVPPSKR